MKYVHLYNPRAAAAELISITGDQGAGVCTVNQTIVVNPCMLRRAAAAEMAEAVHSRRILHSTMDATHLVG